MFVEVWLLDVATSSIAWKIMWRKELFSWRKEGQVLVKRKGGSMQSRKFRPDGPTLVVIDKTPREVEAIVPSDRKRLMTSGTRE